MTTYINFLISKDVKQIFINFYSGTISKDQLLTRLQIEADNHVIEEEQMIEGLYSYLESKAKENGRDENLYSSNSSLAGVYDSDMELFEDYHVSKIDKALAYIRKQVVKALSETQYN